MCPTGDRMYGAQRITSMKAQLPRDACSLRREGTSDQHPRTWIVSTDERRNYALVITVKTTNRSPVTWRYKRHAN
jgi:hypothetical protein